jgi:hypothetical protein
MVIKETGKFAYRFIFPQISRTIPIRPHRIDEYREYINEEGRE